jgi:hypothetical protein
VYQSPRVILVPDMSGLTLPIMQTIGMQPVQSVFQISRGNALHLLCQLLWAATAVASSVLTSDLVACLGCRFF